MRYKIIHERSKLRIEEAINDFIRQEMGATLEHFCVVMEPEQNFVAVFRYCPA